MEIKKFNEHNIDLIDPKEPKEIRLKYMAFDWDDNILHMPTVIHMDKKEGGEWIPTDLSTSDFAKYRGDHENYRIKNNDPNQAFCEFRDFGPRGSTAFLEDCKTALNEGRFAPSWKRFISCLSQGAIFSIITARGHEPESIKEAIEYIIDNILTKLPSQNPGRKLIDDMYHNIGKYMYYFNEMDHPVTDIRIKGRPSKDPIIQKYLNQCDFYGITSTFFSNKFGGGNLSFGTANPEKAKEIALEAFVEKCNKFGERLSNYLDNHNIGMKVKSVSVGFSDDDPRNVAHVNKYFSEKPLDTSGYKLKLNVYDTSDRDIEGGKRTRHYVKESNQSVTDTIPNSTMSLQRTPAGLFQSDVLDFKTFNKKVIEKITKETTDKISKKKSKKEEKEEVSESKKHPGFKKVASKIAKQQKLSIKKASAILAASTRKASKKAKKKNPKLKKVK